VVTWRVIDVPARRKKKSHRRGRPAYDARLNVVIDPELKEWVREYAVRKHTSITALIVGHFIELREIDEGGNVEQI
jgi:hypothetical protein